jgi:NADPH:quinone reductase-like Zn-dependent oxidoreductase
MQSDSDFQQQVQRMTEELRATAVFDGVGGAVLTNIIEMLPFGSTIFAYGWLGGGTPLTFHTSLLMKGLTVRGFNNYKTSTVQDPQKLEDALKDISSMLGAPHFKTKIGKQFKFEDVKEALKFTSTDSGKAVLHF